MVALAGKSKPSDSSNVSKLIMVNTRKIKDPQRKQSNRPVLIYMEKMFVDLEFLFLLELKMSCQCATTWTKVACSNNL